MSTAQIKVIGLAAETESPENPGGLEKRAALIPEGVKALVDFGCDVYFQTGVGAGIGFPDESYIAAGAKPQEEGDLYANKDMVIKFKGPSMKNIALMSERTLLFCMAHFKSFPDRARLLEDKKINVLAMEEILENPKHFSDSIIISKKFVENTLYSLGLPFAELNISFIGYHENIVGGIRRAGNKSSKTLQVYQNDVSVSEIQHTGKNSIYFYDSRNLIHKDIIAYLEEKEAQLFDFKPFHKFKAKETLDEYKKTHLPFDFGGRRIQCLHETGMAGARYGYKLLKEESPKEKLGKEANVAVLGYGNVGMGAIHEMFDQGSRVIHILSRVNTTPERIEPYLEDIDLIINGAEQPSELRGKNYLITTEHTTEVMEKGSVVIDLVGGSATNRSAVEDVIACTFLTNPSFEKNGIYFSALWGWPMMGMMRESAITYSGQIIDVLLKREKLINGLYELTPGVRRALVCGPW